MAAAARAQAPQAAPGAAAAWLLRPRAPERLSLRSRRAHPVPCQRVRRRSQPCTHHHATLTLRAAWQALAAAAQAAPAVEAAPGEAEAIARRFELTQTQTLCAVELPQRLVAVRACCARLLLAG